MNKRKPTTRRIRPQARNANKHTQGGMRKLERSIQQDGWIGAVTVAADGEAFDGSARVEITETALPGEDIVVETDGKRRVVVVRTDIPNADDPRAVRLGLAANEIHYENYDPDGDVLAAIMREDASALEVFSRERLAQIQNLLPDIEFPEYDESIADGVEVCKCLHCGHEHHRQVK